MPSQGDSHLKATIAANLDRAVTASGLSNREVADKIGKTEHQVWRWRKGHHQPELSTLVALADAFFDGDISRFYVDPDKVAA